VLLTSLLNSARNPSESHAEYLIHTLSPPSPPTGGFMVFNPLWSKDPAPTDLSDDIACRCAWFFRNGAPNPSESYAEGQLNAVVNASARPLAANAI